jgi:hypothetical protein
MSEGPNFKETPITKIKAPLTYRSHTGAPDDLRLGNWKFLGIWPLRHWSFLRPPLFPVCARPEGRTNITQNMRLHRMPLIGRWQHARLFCPLLARILSIAPVLLLVLATGLAAAPAQSIPVAGGERADSQAKGMIVMRGVQTPADPLGEALLEFSYSNPDQARAHYWWGTPPKGLLARGLRQAGRSNIYKHDYAGPETCRECHQANYNKWQTHSHRLMNALATPENVKGDFSGKAVMNYLGGKVHFYQETGTNYMRL